MADAAAMMASAQARGDAIGMERPMSAQSYASERRAQASAAVHMDKPLNSHREHRVTVPMPKSLDEMRAVAQRRFPRGRGLYHHGRRHLSHPNHMVDVNHDDVVVVGHGGEEERDAPPTTTSRSHYVKHPIDSRAMTPENPHPGEPATWYGESRYSTDFAPKAYQRPPPAIKPPDGLRVGTGTTGKSTYRAQYPWLDTARAERKTNYERHERPGPFDGTSSYQSDFNSTYPQPRPRSLKAPPSQKRVPGDFYGDSTYNTHFVPTDGTRAASMGRPPTLSLGDAPFDGTSEYAHRYIKHPHERKAHLHMEPQKRDGHESYVS